MKTQFKNNWATLLQPTIIIMRNCDQQQEEGFFSNQLIIQDSRQFTPIVYQQRPTDYQPRVLQAQPILRKLPPQTLEYFPSLSYKRPTSQPTANPAQPPTDKQPSKTPYEKFEQEQFLFKLIYSKQGGNPFRQAKESFASRQIKLPSYSRFEEQHYNLLRSWQQNDIKIPQTSPNSLEFDSRFECGNLLCAYRGVKQQYFCFMQNDTNTQGYNQWFYFSLKGVKEHIKYRIHILNFKKKFSFFRNGMKPVVYSLRQHKESGNGWFRMGQNISYKTSPIHDIQQEQNVKLYCLSFDLIFENDEDFITVSSGIPYSYSRLINHLKKCEQIATRSEITWKMRTIAYSLSNNQVPYLTITNSNDGSKKVTKLLKLKKKISLSNPADEDAQKIILILARQHPGQTQSSFLMEQLLLCLSKNDTPQVKSLLQRYQFRIFPMVNVDGVIYGNYRCDVAGFDLNRTWKNPIKELHPQIYAIKEEIIQLKEQGRIVCCLDLHSHSKQYNIFSYCCKQDEAQSRLLSYMISKLNRQFHFPFCTFGLSKQKETTARATISSIIKHFNVITVEVSSYAAKLKDQISEIGPFELGNLAYSIIKAMKSYFFDDPLRLECLNQVIEKISDFLDMSKKNWQEMSGSDSDPEADEGDFQSKLKRILPSSDLKNIQNKINQKAKLPSVSQRQIPQKMKRVQKSDIKIQKQQDISISNERKGKQKPQRKKSRPKKNNHITKISINSINTPQLSSKLEHQIIIQLPMDEWKTKLNRAERIITELKSEQAQFYKETQQLQKLTRRGKPSNKSSSFIGSQFKVSMKQLYSELKNKKIDQTQIKNISTEQHEVINRNESQMEKKDSILKKLSKLEKILRVRRRTSNFKSMSREEPVSEEDYHLLQIRADYRTIQEPSSLQNDSREKTKHISQLISQKQTLSKHEVLKQAKQRRESRSLLKAKANASIISQIWRVNYGRYYKQLK